jgi:hypothetical protein
MNIQLEKGAMYAKASDLMSFGCNHLLSDV